jgi:hypothetical protein
VPIENGGASPVAGGDPAPPLRSFATVAELAEALREFQRLYTEQRLIERHGYRTPDQVRLAKKAVTTAVA